MIYKVLGTNFSVDIVMADHVFGCQFQFLAQSCGQVYHRLIGCIVEFAGLIRMADLYGYGVVIAGAFA